MKIIRVLVYVGEDEKVETQLDMTYIRPKHKPQRTRLYGKGLDLYEEFRGTQEEFDKWKEKK